MSRRRKTSKGNDDWTRPIIGLVMLGVLYLAFQFGLVDAIAQKLVGLIAPKGETNAGVIYRREMERKGGS